MKRPSPAVPDDFFGDPLRRLDASPMTADGFLFSGNRHESVPRALFFDRRLILLERNAWQIIRLRLNDDGVTAFPTYEELRPLLSSMPCAPKASHETVARDQHPAPHSLAESRAKAALPQDRTAARQSVCPARRAPDAV